MKTKEEILDKHFSMKDQEIEKWKVLAAMEEYAAQFKDSPYQGSAGVWRSAAKPPGITQWYVVKCEQRRFASLIYVDSKITLERVAKDIDAEIDLLEWLDESISTPAGDGWVSVEDGLPGFNEEVLVFGKRRMNQPVMGGNPPRVWFGMRQDLTGSSIPKTDQKRYVDKNNFRMMEEVTHWRPLPSPPKTSV